MRPIKIHFEVRDDGKNVWLDPMWTTFGVVDATRRLKQLPNLSNVWHFEVRTNWNLFWHDTCLARMKCAHHDVINCSIFSLMAYIDNVILQMKIVFIHFSVFLLWLPVSVAVSFSCDFFHNERKIGWKKCMRGSVCIEFNLKKKKIITVNVQIRKKKKLTQTKLPF